MIIDTQKPCVADGPDNRNEQGFTLLETAIALIVMMVVTLATGSLFGLCGEI
jgi:type II secretory pathway pseudopilin PulG